MTATSIPVSLVKSQPDRIYGPQLRGRWRITAITFWAVAWLICLMVMLLSAYFWYGWDSLPVDEWNRRNNYVPSSASEQESKIAFQEEIIELGFSLPFYGGFFFCMRLIAGIPFLILSFLIVRRRSDRLMAIFFAIVLVAIGAAGRFLSPNWSILPDNVALDAQLNDLQMLAVNSIVTLLDILLDCSAILLFIFPDGRFVLSGSRWLALTAVVDIIARTITFSWITNSEAYYSLGRFIDIPQVISSAGWQIRKFYEWLGANHLPLPTQIAFILGVLALVYRYRRVADAVQKQQIKWFLLGILLLLPFYVTHYLFYVSSIFDRWTEAWTLREGLILQLILEPGWYVAQGLLAVCIAIALLRYRLWDIKIILNRSLVYAALTITMITLYGLSVGALSTLFKSSDNPLISIAATGLAAVAIQPIHGQLQRLVNRLMYSERDDPYAVLARLANTLEKTPSTDQVLPTIATAIAQALKVPFVSIHLNDGGTASQVAAFGQPVENYLSYPLIYQNETIGSLHVARRTPGEEFSAADRRLIENIARQAGSAAQAVRLNTELARSRTQVIIAREEERRRLRRDLHDGLGPILASQTLKMAAARQLVEKNPPKAENLIDDIIQQNENTIAEVRRLVYGLRPPSLDALGLVGAVHDLALRDGNEELNRGGMKTTITAPEEGLPLLPAAIEVNAYRITLEALTNAARHARAEHFTVEFSCAFDGAVPTALVIQMSDDGIGIPANYRAGVGLRSMRERAAELGGKLTIERVEPHGTRISCWLPVTDLPIDRMQ